MCVISRACLFRIEACVSFKLGHYRRNYAIYRSEKGIYVQFSDDENEEADQRRRFTEICPELCELRYFTSQMHSNWTLPFYGRRDEPSLYNHNIAQAIWLVMEDRVDLGKPIAQQALRMAVRRATNDNTIRYVRACLIAWLAWMLLSGPLIAFAFRSVPPFETLGLYVIAGMFGATGAVLSVATRLQAFQLQPCNQSNMNYWMSAIRVGIGIIAGIVLFLFSPTILGEPLTQFVPGWRSPSQLPQPQAAAALGFVAGFAERLVPNILRWTSAQLEPSVGTPAQAVRNEEKR